MFASNSLNITPTFDSLLLFQRNNTVLKRIFQVFTARKVIFSQASVILSMGGGGYPSMPCGRGCAIPVCIAGGIPACLAAERVLSQHALQGDSAPGGLLPGGMSALGFCAWWRPPGRPLLRAVRILLECILACTLFCAFI